MANVLTRLFGSANERTIKRLLPLVQEIASFEEEYQALPDSAFPAKTAGVESAGDGRGGLARRHPARGLRRGARGVAAHHRAAPLRRAVLGGIVLHQGKIAEMKTGEGKTLVATLPLYLNALTGKGAHLVTVNDYLARRDVQWMGPIYHFLGLTVGVDRPRHQLPLRPHATSRRTTACSTCARSSAATPTAPTSPTAPTTSSASTTCATT